MRYIIYSPKHEKTIPEIKKTNGEVIPERVYTVPARALYRDRKLANRRYRRDYPDPKMILLKFSSLKQAQEELESLIRYCGEREEWEIHEYENGTIGSKIVFIKA